MKYSYNWLKELSGTKYSAEKIAQLFTLHAFEIEGIKKSGAEFENVIVGKILEIAKHPDADRLQITTVDTGKEKLQIVCGANNISVGDVVPVALVGAKLPASPAGGPNGLEIKAAEIRGVKSQGMLCAKDELGLGTDHSGIVLLDKKTKIGAPFAKVMGLDDTILEIDVLANRAHDALSHVGMAREITALEGKEMEYAYDEIELPVKKSKKITVKIDGKDICSRYIGAVIEDVEIGESPEWMKTRLEQCGIRSINNIVDTTNYVMLELGQPLHAFDLEKISGDIIVRNAKKGEKIKILDGNIKELTEKDIVIADKNGAIALAGVMGGAESGIDADTKKIVLEAATFDAPSIRRTRMNSGLLTDAALRFEKGLDPNLAEKAMTRAIEIIEHIANGKLEGAIDVYPKVQKPWTIMLDLDYVNKLLGEKIPAQVGKKILSSLGFVVKGTGNKLSVTVPTFRIDVTTQEDLIEEIGRMHGYDKIKSVAPVAPVQSPVRNEKWKFQRELKNILAAQGFNEVYNYSFYSQRDAGLAQLGSIKHLELSNPANPEQALMRISLIPNLLKNVRENLKNFKEFNIFEMGHVYWPNGGVLPEEKTMLVGAVVLEKKSAKQEAQDKRHQSSFYELKSHVDQLMERIGIDDFYYDTLGGNPPETPPSLWHQSRSAEIKIEGNDKAAGYMGEINPLVLSQFGIKTRVAMFEFDLEQLNQIAEGEREYKPIAKYPTVIRDISLLAGADTRVDDILQTIQQAGGNLVLDVDLFDAIDFADNSTSFAFHIILGADDHTLTGKEIDEVMEKIIASLEKELSVKVRK